MGSVAAIAPNCASYLGFNIMLREFCDISFQPEMDHVITNYILLLHGLMMQACRIHYCIIKINFDFDTTSIISKNYKQNISR